jgi:autotransporter passenger strand-loop-strand repeat protein
VIDGGQQFVNSATAITTVVNSGDQNLFSNGIASATTLNSGGQQIINAGGTASGTVANAFGLQTVSAGGIALSFTATSSGEQVVSSGGMASGVLLSGSFATQFVFSGGTGADVTVDSGGDQEVFGGIVSTTTLNGGSNQDILLGGTAVGTILNSGGLENIFDGGVASGTVVNGGLVTVSAGSLAIGATINSGGDQLVSGGGTAKASVINSGGVQDILSGGTGLGATISNGGIEFVETGGTATDVTIAGGALSWHLGGSVNGPITFTGAGGDLFIEAASMPANVISGLLPGDRIDLAAARFDSGGTVQLLANNVLQIVENGTTYRLQLDPSGNYASEPFRLKSDGFGGTDVIIARPALSIATSVAARLGFTTALSPNAAVFDQARTTLAGATIGVTGGGFAGDGDVLAAMTSGTSISASYNSAMQTLTLSGTDTLANYQSVLDSVSITLGANAASDGHTSRTITWQLNDGAALSTPATATLNLVTDATRLVVSPVSASVTVAHQHPVAASSLFTAHDALGMPIVQYDFWDNGGAGGAWLLNGVPLGLNQDNFVPASQLSLVTYRGGAGTETIWERASDGIGFGAWVSLSATDTAPVVTPSSANVNVGHAMVAASSLFTAGDADTDNIVQYEFFDSGQAGGHWVLNGIVQPDNQTISISASQLAQMTYRGGSGTETIWERASDGVQFGAWVSLNATGTESAPAVAPTSASVVASYKSSVAATTLFTVYDRDGDLITQYDFWDNGAGGGHWSINGVAQGSNVEIIVNASQLSQVTYTPGAGTDTLFVRANDGLLWSAWTAGFSATDVAPVSTPVHNSVSGAGSKSYAFSELFTVSDADGDPATVYDLWDNGAGGGHWSVNGVAQGSNQEILVNASQISQVTYQSGSGTDTLFLRASDGLHFGAWTQGVSVANAPVANPNQSAFTLSHTQSVAATTLFTATDADGDPITKYDFWDNGMGGGHWSINGVAQGSNVEIIVNASQLSQVTYTPGAGTDTLFVRVNDGTQWSAWTPGFTAVDGAPVSTWYTNSLVASTGQTFAASALFAATDADTDRITQYDFWDNGTGGGHWSVNGVVQGSNKEIVVNASQLSQVTYTAGTGTDSLFVRTNDGIQWGPWTPAFTATGGTQPSSVTVPGGGGVEIGTAGSHTDASFVSNTGTLMLGDSQHYAGTVAGLVGQDSLDLADINFINGTTTATLMNATSAGGTLHVTDGTHQANIALLGNYMASMFVSASDGHGGTTIVDPQTVGAVQPLVAPPHA